MIFRDAASISGVENSLIITKAQKPRCLSNPDKNTKNMRNYLKTDLQLLIWL